MKMATTLPIIPPHRLSFIFLFSVFLIILACSLNIA